MVEPGEARRAASAADRCSASERAWSARSCGVRPSAGRRAWRRACSAASRAVASARAATAPCRPCSTASRAETTWRRGAATSPDRARPAGLPPPRPGTAARRPPDPAVDRRLDRVRLPLGRDQRPLAHRDQGHPGGQDQVAQAASSRTAGTSQTAHRPGPSAASDRTVLEKGVVTVGRGRPEPTGRPGRQFGLIAAKRRPKSARGPLSAVRSTA